MCLKRLNYDRKELEKRREESQHEIKGKLVRFGQGLPGKVWEQPWGSRGLPWAEQEEAFCASGNTRSEKEDIAYP